MTENQKYVLIPKKVPGENFQSLEPEFQLLEPSQMNAEFSKLELDELLPKADALVAITDVDAEMIAKALNLKLIVANGAGYDNIDITAATALQIPVFNIPDATAFSTAELALGLMLNVSRRISEADRALHTKIDDVSEFFAIGRNPGRTLANKTLGIVGLGHIGMALAEMCWPLRMNIVYHSRNRLPLAQEKGIRYLSFEDLLKVSDIISIHVPITEQTRNMFNYDAFMKMKPGAILINTARGAVIDHEALVYFLESGKLAGVGLDVFPEEPKIPPKLLGQERAVLTPHIGTNTIETRQFMAERICDVIREVCRKPLEEPIRNLVNPEIFRRKEIPQAQSVLPGFEEPLAPNAGETVDP